MTSLARSIRSKFLPHFIIEERHLKAECRRLGVYAVRTAYHHGLFMLNGAPFKSRHKSLDIFDYKG